MHSPTHLRQASPVFPECERLNRSDELIGHSWTLLSKLALGMQPRLLIPKETPSSGRLYVIAQGVALEKTQSRLMTVNDNWGAVEAICGPTPFLHGASFDQIEALTFLQVFSIDNEELLSILQSFPELGDSWLKLRAWALE